MKPLLPLAAFLLLSGCASDYSFSTNLDPENFDEYFEPGKVALMGADTPVPGDAQMLGMVEGLSCQASPQDRPADDREARTQLRQEAAKLGANAVKVRRCLALEDLAGCVAARACYGQAYLLSETR